MRTALILVTLSFLAYGRTAQLCNPGSCRTIDTTVIGGRNFSDYRVTNRKAVNTAQRRAVLATNPASAAAICAINPYAGVQGTLPTVSWGTAAVNLSTSSFMSGANIVTNQAATIAFTNIVTSDGYSLPKFGMYMVRALNATAVYMQFRPTIDSNLQGIPGFTQDVQWVADPTAQSLAFPNNLSSLSQPLQRLILAVVANLPAIYSNASQVNSSPNSAGLPVWTQADATNVAATAVQLIFSVPTQTFAPVTTLTCDVSPTAYTSCQETSALNKFGAFLMQSGADYLNSATPGTIQNVVSNLRSWAIADALLTFPGYQPGNPNQDDTRIRYTINTTISLPLAYTWGMIRIDPAVSAADRSTIDQWVNRVVTFAQTPYNDQVLPDANNHGYLQASVRMAWAISMGDDEGFAESVERYYVAVNQMNPDGSLPWEVGRGACSTRYQGIAVSNLIAIAELAASQGYDLYSLNVNGVSIHTAVAFMLSAINNPAVILAYAGSDAAPCDLPASSAQDISPLVNAGASGDGLTTAFIEQYVARFPTSTLASQLRSLLQPGGLAANRPLYNSGAGANTSCLTMTDSFTTLTVSGSTSAIPVAGGTGTLQVQAASGTPSWTAESSAPWLSLANTSGNGSGAIAYTVAANPQPTVRTATIAAGNQVFTLTQPGISSATAPVISAVVDAASYRSAGTPGAFVAITGANLSNTTRTWAAADFSGSQLPTKLDSVSVQIDGKAAAVYFVSPGQINAQVPDDATTGEVTVSVMAPSGLASGTFKIQEAAPGFYELPPPALNSVIATHADYTLVGPAGLYPGVTTTPAKPGETIVLFGTGFGATTPTTPAGALVSTPAPVTLNPAVYIGGYPATIQYAGIVTAALWQINLTVPAQVQNGSATVRVLLNGFEAQPLASLAVGQ